MASTLGSNGHARARRPPARISEHADTCNEHGQRGEHERRAEDGAHADPVAGRRADRRPASRIATSGIIVSGSAVPTAARTLPTAPSASSSLRPNHSMPLVNSSAARSDYQQRRERVQLSCNTAALVRAPRDAAVRRAGARARTAAARRGARASAPRPADAGARHRCLSCAAARSSPARTGSGGGG